MCNAKRQHLLRCEVHEAAKDADFTRDVLRDVDAAADVSQPPALGESQAGNLGATVPRADAQLVVMTSEQCTDEVQDVPPVLLPASLLGTVRAALRSLELPGALHIRHHAHHPGGRVLQARQPPLRKLAEHLHKVTSGVVQDRCRSRPGMCARRTTMLVILKTHGTRTLSAASAGNDDRRFSISGSL